MRIKTWLIGLSLLSTVGCSAMNNTEKGLLGGAAIGTGAGALLTHGHPAGMLIGGALGAMTGGAVGSNQDYREDRRAATQAYANAQAQRMVTVPEVIQLTQQRTHESIIIGQINANGCARLTTNDILDMQNHGVSPNVIAAMQAPRYARPVVVAPRHDVVFIEGPPPPPPQVGFGVVVGR